MAGIIKCPGKAEYDLTLAETDVPVVIKIGGNDKTTKGKFIPNINSSKWNNECWLNINHPNIVNAEKESFVDGKLEIAIGSKTHRYYVAEGGKLEYEIEFAAKPQSNIIELALNFPDGLRFDYQDTLENEYKKDSLWYKTLEDYLADHNRPPNVVGSYAVKWAPGGKTKKNNQYKTGKFCHIYRPKLIDANNKVAWCGLGITGKTLAITMPQWFLDTATYPIRLDPTIGYTTNPESSNRWEDYIVICRFACGEDGTCNPGTFYVFGAENHETEVTGCVYQDNSGTAASQPKLSSSEGEVTLPNLGSETWVTATITVAGGFSNGVDYWIGGLHHATQMFYDTATPGYDDCEFDERNYEDGLLANFFVSPSGTAREYGYYIDYTAGGISIPVVIHHLKMAGGL